MEADEIRVVLARASELHGKFNEAIERASKTDFLRSSSGAILESDFTSVVEGDVINGMGSFDRDFVKAATKDGISNAEARTLGLIRDALEALEEQLQALQSMQNHQRAEKDAVLAELEESRNLLLIKLKNHRGREWEVVREALAFAGEPVEERDDLLLPPYPRPVGDDSLAVNTPPSKHLSRTISLPKGRAVKKLLLPERDQEVDKDVLRNKDVSEVVSAKEDSQGQVISKHKVNTDGVVTSAGGFMRGLGGRVGHALVHAAKAVLVVASVVAFLAFTEHNHRQVEQMPRQAPSAAKPIFPPESRARSPSPLKCSPGKKRIVLEDGSEKCVVKERFELPFSREVESPDVLYGRG